MIIIYIIILFSFFIDLIQIVARDCNRLLGNHDFIDIPRADYYMDPRMTTLSIKMDLMMSRDDYLTFGDHFKILFSVA